MKNFILIPVFLLINTFVYAQNKYRVGLLPQINAGATINNTYSLNAKLENRFVAFEGFTNEKFKPSLNYERTDLELVISKKLNSLNSFGVGYLSRITDGKFTHRAIQQYSISQKINSLKLAHRFRTDQTFQKNEKTIFRARYRLGLEKPLNGAKLDPKEFYLKFNNEYLSAIQNGRIDFEIRALAVLGYSIDKKNKIEMGFDYRIEDLRSSTKSHLGWLNVNWYINF